MVPLLTIFTQKTHHILGDEKKDFGGDDLGLSPYELLNAAIRKNIYIVLTLKNIQRKQWDLKRFRIFKLF